MGLYRVTRDTASVVFGCGHDHSFPLSDLRVRGRVVEFPICPTCRSVYLFVQCVTCVDVPPRLLARYRAIQTLHKRLHDLGLHADGSTATDMDASMHVLACDEDVVEDHSRKRRE